MIFLTRLVLHLFRVNLKSYRRLKTSSAAEWRPFWPKAKNVNLSSLSYFSFLFISDRCPRKRGVRDNKGGREGGLIYHHSDFIGSSPLKIKKRMSPPKSLNLNLNGGSIALAARVFLCWPKVQIYIHPNDPRHPMHGQNNHYSRVERLLVCSSYCIAPLWFVQNSQSQRCSKCINL